MVSTPVSKDQFEIDSRGITHTPTGASYSAHPGSPFSGTMSFANLGNKLRSGEDYRPQEVQQMMEQLWAEYVEANPGEFTKVD